MQNNNSVEEAYANRLINDRKYHIYLSMTEFLKNHSKQINLLPEITSENESIIASFIDDKGFYLYQISQDDKLNLIYEVEPEIIHFKKTLNKNKIYPNS